LPEKKRLIDELPTLIQFQVDGILRIFGDEIEAFKGIWEKRPHERPEILEVRRRMALEWELLKFVCIAEYSAERKALAFIRGLRKPRDQG
jgi:hypothetical protein